MSRRPPARAAACWGQTAAWRAGRRAPAARRTRRRRPPRLGRPKQACLPFLRRRASATAGAGAGASSSPADSAPEDSELFRSIRSRPGAKGAAPASAGRARASKTKHLLKKETPPYALSSASSARSRIWQRPMKFWPCSVPSSSTMPVQNGALLCDAWRLAPRSNSTRYSVPVPFSVSAYSGLAAALAARIFPQTSFCEVTRKRSSRWSSFSSRSGGRSLRLCAGLTAILATIPAIG